MGEKTSSDEKCGMQGASSYNAACTTLSIFLKYRLGLKTTCVVFLNRSQAEPQRVASNFKFLGHNTQDAITCHRQHWPQTSSRSVYTMMRHWPQTLSRSVYTMMRHWPQTLSRSVDTMMRHWPQTLSRSVCTMMRHWPQTLSRSVYTMMRHWPQTSSRSVYTMMSDWLQNEIKTIWYNQETQLVNEKKKRNSKLQSERAHVRER